MEGEEGGDMPPFWLNNNRNRRRSSNFLTNSGFLIIILTIIALFLIFFVVPSFLSFTSQYVKPHLVKKNWDSLNIVLVFFAIICGFLSRRTADDVPAGVADNGFSNLSSQRALVEEDEPIQLQHRHHHQNHLRYRPMETDQPWIGYSNTNPMMYSSVDNLSSLSSTSSNVRGGMRRNSSSYPDLRQESLWNQAPETRRFYDDINVDGYQYGGELNYLHRRHPSDPIPAPVPSEYQYGESNYLQHHNSAPVPATVPESDDTKYFSDTKTIPVDTFVVRQQEVSLPEPPPVAEPTEKPPPPRSPEKTPAPPLPEKPPQPPRPPTAVETRRKERAERRAFRSIERREKPVEEKKDLESEKAQTQPSIPPPSAAPPPLQPAEPSKSEQKSAKSERKRSSNAAKEIKNTFTSLYNQRKNKKKNKQKSKESFDDMFHQMFEEPASQSYVGPPPSPPPPPPPPPPPSSVFHQLFKKSSKTKKIHSDSVPPPAPPPPPTKPSRSSRRRVQNQDPSPPTPEITPQPARSPPKPETSRRKKPSTPGKPPLPTSRSSNAYFPSDELYPNSGNQSPLIPMPPPPPPPPFKMSAMKFVVRGDFVRIRSRTSRNGSTELLDDAPSAQESPMDTPISTPRIMDNATDGESSIPSSPFCPSPDVDYKADSFIARFRAGLKNEI
ncbi:proteoglycan 4-like [Papaver somniferum]|uniref:proteoglycan 4-like n=1 Tax=Papaver somniferum TaxID=3469 RepID=UPI000E6FC55D|nr:proteoglycan 4-like [Papaver somniferum]